ncbi:MAG: ABC transporter permease subunit, partial [Candidatus Latescibacterota bacterium]
MTWTIARRELLSHLVSLRFAACLVLCTGLSAVSCHLLAGEYGQRLSAYGAARDRSRQVLEQVQVYAQLRPEVHRPPRPLSVLAEGLDRRIGTACTIALEEVPFALTGTQAANEFAPVFPVLDFATVVSVVLSLLALLLAYDAFSGERELGTLRMCLANACPRHALLLGKYLGGLLGLAVSLGVTLVVCLLV